MIFSFFCNLFKQLNWVSHSNLCKFRNDLKFSHYFIMFCHLTGQKMRNDWLPFFYLLLFKFQHRRIGIFSIKNKNMRCACRNPFYNHKVLWNFPNMRIFSENVFRNISAIHHFTGKKLGMFYVWKIASMLYTTIRK